MPCSPRAAGSRSIRVLAKFDAAGAQRSQAQGGGGGGGWGGQAPRYVAWL